MHYEVEFIHPFTDGNGRMGRLWQTVLLHHWNPVFLYIPIESLIRENQDRYYDVLSESDKNASSTVFIEFMLSIINKSIDNFLKELNPVPITSADRIAYFKTHCKEKSFTRKDYINYFKTISSATASRDLKEHTDQKVLKKEGKQNQTIYYFTTQCNIL